MRFMNNYLCFTEAEKKTTKPYVRPTDVSTHSVHTLYPTPATTVAKPQTKPTFTTRLTADRTTGSNPFSVYCDFEYSLSSATQTTSNSSRKLPFLSVRSVVCMTFRSIHGAMPANVSHLSCMCGTEVYKLAEKWRFFSLFFGILVTTPLSSTSPPTDGGLNGGRTSWYSSKNDGHAGYIDIFDYTMFLSSFTG